MITRQCKKCGQVKALDEFPNHKQCRDGKESRCIECKKKYLSNYRKENLSVLREYDRSRPPRFSKEQVCEAVKKSQRKYPERAKARKMVVTALRRGDLQKTACFTCGELEVEAHHADYSNPLGVIWLCRKHHEEVHHGV